jgi:hypothetical protein
MRVLLASFASLVLLCCAASPPSAAPPLTPGDSPPAVGSGGPAGSASAPVPAASASAVAPASPFLAVAELPAVSRVFPVEGALFVAAQEKVQQEDDSIYPIGVLRNDRLEFPKNLAVEGWFHRIDDIQGTWPEGVDMIAVTDTGRAALAEHFVLSAAGWQRKGKFCDETRCEGNSRYLGMVRRQGGIVALRAAPMPYSPPVFEALRGSAPNLRFTPAPRDCQEQIFQFTKVAVLPLIFGSLRDGTLLSYGRDCSGKAAIESWKPGGGASTLAPLPFEAREDSFAETGRLLRGPENGAWLLASKILQFDGATWKEIPGPGGKPTEIGATGPDGALWVASGPSIFRRSKDGWEEAPLPADAAAPDDVAVDEQGVVWVSAGNTLFRTRRPGESGPGIAPKAPLAPRKPAKKFASLGSPRCVSNLVLLYAFSRVTPADYDFPLTRKAIKGRKEYEGTRFVVVQDGGKKFFSALMPSFQLGQKLVKLIEKEVPNSRPQLLCAEPEILREVKIDLATGNVVK